MQGAGARRARASLPPLFGPPVFDPPVFDHVRILPSGRRILGELRPARQTGRTVGSPVLSGLVTGSLTRNFLSGANRSEEHTSELQSLMRISYAVFCWKKKHKRILV